MNIASLQSLGAGVQLGPCVLKKVWPFKEGDKSVNGVLTDSSGEISFKAWGLTPQSGLAEGRVVTFASGGGPKSGITHTEFPVGSGKWSMNINGCRLEFQQGHVEPVQAAYQPPAASYAPAPVQTPYTPPQAPQTTHYPTQPLGPVITSPPPGGCLTEDQFIARFNRVTMKSFAGLIDTNAPMELAVAAACKAAEVGALHWFGKKYIGQEAGE